ncbi:MAG: O-antigen ligase family protein [Anaerolineae bacterium]|nr:O-antigen ligase family protein [Anaerolineae bacterium]
MTLWQHLQRFARPTLALAEPAVLLVMTVAFWHHSPPIRDAWVWLLVLALPVFALRLLAYQRLATWSPLLAVWLALLLLTAWNFAAAPLRRADYLVLVCRPLLGVWLALYCVEQVRVRGRFTILLVASAGMGLVAGGLALTATAWNEKSELFRPLLAVLPRPEYRTLLPDMLLSFNANEIAGALAWLCPLLAGIALLPGRDVPARALRLAGAAGFVLTAAALFLGQSRFATGGVLLALLLLCGLWLRGHRRRIALAGLALVLAAQAALTLNLLPGPAGPGPGGGSGLSPRDEVSLSNRGDIWRSALLMLRDHPLTGVGMSMYRSAVRQEPYTIPYYVARDEAPPHAHNEWLQIAADLGLPGLALVLLWQGLMVVGLWRVWQQGRGEVRLLALAVGGGLLAHAVYGLGDAITLWDRYQFLLWWLSGLAAALIWHTRAGRAQP